MMAKKAKKTAPQKPVNSLIADIERQSPARSMTGPTTWWDRFAKTDPVSSADLREACLNWIGGGVVRDRFPTMASLYRYLAGSDPERPRERALPIDCGKYDSFNRYVSALRNLTGEPKTVS